MRKFIASIIVLVSIAAVVDACPQAVRRERVRIVQRPVVQRQVVRERVVRQPVVVERQVIRQRAAVEYYSAPVVVEQLNTECQSGCQVQEFRSNFVRSY